MPRPSHQAALSAAFWLTLLAVTTPSRVSGQTTDSYLKSLLNEYYAGKMVRAKVVIPAGQKGLEIVDGQITLSIPAPDQAAAQPGDSLLITQLRFTSKRIEVEFAGNGEELSQQTASAGKSFAGKSVKLPAPRLQLQFSREITTRDLNIQTINRLLAAAVDVSLLVPEKTGQPPTAISSESPDRHSNAAQIALRLAERRANAEGIPTAPTATEGTVTEPGVGEVAIVSTAQRSRLYIDGAFSGQTPRNLRILAGVHTILVILDGYAPWEKKFFIPAGKLSIVAAQMQPTSPRK
ncbi:MAG TPA: PEGA domain-containing protein [Blastocatellia bacterium]|nr:PEGA domain-containing protein [Blastocatellia bacterium]